jgi:tetratricopeptide (TPR) repeat protein
MATEGPTRADGKQRRVLRSHAAKGFPRLVPQANLLEQVDGVERALRFTRRVGIGGWLAFAASAVPVTIFVVQSSWWRALVHLDWEKLAHHWKEGAALGGIVLFILLINWTRIWVRESRQPFRYTYSVESFEGVAGEEAPPPLEWLRVDLLKLLNERVGRLAFLDLDRLPEGASVPQAHVHVGGNYVIRQERDGVREGEVVPWVMLGAPPTPATVGQAVTFDLPVEGTKGADDPRHYEKLLEHVYFSIATHLYRQIRKDVDKKIALLPKRFFRAAAYFYEADDYVKSNTLDAYTEAQDLFGKAIGLYRPDWACSSSATRLRRVIHHAGRFLASFSLLWRRLFARLWPRLGRVEVMVARCETGFANVLVDRRELASLAGRWVNPIYPARSIAEHAVKRLRSPLLADVPGRDDALFDAHVALASSLAGLGSLQLAGQELDKAQHLAPARAEQDARYLYVRGRAVPRKGSRFFRRAVEIAPWFEPAKFALAYSEEMSWRRRPTLERTVAETVIARYEAVLDRNPGNVCAWANVGYVYWLLGDLDEAEAALTRGRESKDIKTETFVSEIDYGLARIAAERGEFEQAYRSYNEAVAALFSQGVSHTAIGFTGYHFECMTGAMLARYGGYKRVVETRYGLARGADDGLGRVRDSVFAFVLNDYGEARLNYFLRTGDRHHLDIAERVLLQARDQVRTRYPMIDYNLSRLERWRVKYLENGELEDTDFRRLLRDTTYSDRIARFEPHWVDGQLERAQSEAARARRAAEAARKAEERAGREREKVKYARARIESTQREADRFELRNDHESSVPAPGGEGGGGAGLQEPVAGVAPPSEPPIPVLVVQPAGVSLGGLTKDVEEHEQNARYYESLHGQLADRSRCSLKSVSDVCAQLVPHQWLFDSDSFDPLAAPRGGRWERELDELHVRALFTWCEAHLVPFSEGWSEDRKRRRGLRLRTRRAPQTSSRPKTDLLLPRRGFLRLLRRLEVTFMPDSVDLLQLFREFPRLKEHDVRDYTEREKLLIKDGLERYIWWGPLTWLHDDELFEQEDRVDVLTRIAGESDLPPALYIEVGDRLYEFDEPQQAIAAYDRVKGVDDARLLGRVATRLEARSEFERAADFYSAACKIDVRAGRTNYANRHRLGVGRCRWKAGDREGAVHQFEAIEQGQGKRLGHLAARWRASLVEELLARDVDPRGYRLLKRWLGRELTRAQRKGDAPTRQDAAAALLKLTSECYLKQVRRPLDPAPEEAQKLSMPGADPVVLEVDADLLPDGDQAEAVARVLREATDDTGLELDERAQAVVRLVRKEIPDRRGELRKLFGIEVPPVRILASEQRGSGSYLIYVSELPVDGGKIPKGACFFTPQGHLARDRGLDGETAANPVDGSAGAWIADREAALAQGLEVWDRYTFMLRHLLAVFERLAGLDTVADLLTAWEAEDPEGRAELRARAVPDEHGLVRLAHVLRGLLGDGLPLAAVHKRLEQILTIVADAPASVTPAELAEEARRQLRYALPGADAQTRLVSLPLEVEQELLQAIRAENGGTFWGLTKEEYDAWRRRIVGELPEAVRAGDVVIVVTERGIRRIVRDLSAYDFPTLPVVVYGELPEGRRLAWQGPDG